MPRSELYGVVIEHVDVIYHAGGRRWLTLNGACRAAAREQLREHIRENMGDNYDYDFDVRLHSLITYLAKRHRRRFRKEKMLP